MKRIVKPELLDALPPDDPSAVRSRRDLLRVNRWMGHVNLLTEVAPAVCEAGKRVAEIGAGDGRFMLSVAARLWLCWPSANVVLVDRQSFVCAETLAGFEKFWWRATAIRMDAFDWLGRYDEPMDVIFANLFLHHFENGALRKMLGLAARRTRCFIACEPRRSWRSLCGSRLLGLIGCNAVTRHDAAVSVRAGFRDQELSALWPATGDWELWEENVGLFSHLFVAIRKN